MEFVGHQGLDVIGPGAAGAGADEGEGDGTEAMVGGEGEGVADGGSNGLLGRGPEPSDAGDVDDGGERESTSAGDDGTAEGTNTRPLSEEALRRASCPVLRLCGAMPSDEALTRVLEALGER